MKGKMEDIEKWGGMGRVVAEISERLPKLGYNVTVLARKKGLHGTPIYPQSYYSPENVVWYEPVKNVDVYAIPPCSGLGERIQPKSGSLYVDNPIDCIVTWDQIFTSINYIYDFNSELNQKIHDESTVIHGYDFYGAQLSYNLKTATHETAHIFGVPARKEEVDYSLGRHCIRADCVMGQSNVVRDVKENDRVTRRFIDAGE